MSLIVLHPARRPCCPRCLRPAAHCICGCIAPVVAALELLILQHPLEVHNAKGTARLLHLCVAGSELVAGECFDPDVLSSLLYAGQRHPVLLYPDTPDLASLGMAPPPLLSEALTNPSRLRLVILDGTWRKSRKMLYLNPALHALPRMPLRAMPPSHYRIRKAHAPDQLSTFEASSYALAQIEGDEEKFLPLLTAFDRFVDQLAQDQTLGRSVRQSSQRT